MTGSGVIRDAQVHDVEERSVLAWWSCIDARMAEPLHRRQTTRRDLGVAVSASSPEFPIWNTLMKTGS
jgi:hypothetical protein